MGVSGRRRTGCWDEESNAFPLFCIVGARKEVGLGELGNNLALEFTFSPKTGLGAVLLPNDWNTLLNEKEDDLSSCVLLLLCD